MTTYLVPGSAFRRFAGFGSTSIERDGETQRATAEADARAHRMVADGWREEAWEATAEAPNVIIDSEGRPSYDRRRTRGWFDHPYQLVHAGRRLRVFVAEPYELSTEALRSLSRLADEGWHVLIDPGRALHYPGRTIAVWIWKGPDSIYPWERATRDG